MRDYFPLQRWAAVSDGTRGVVMASLETLLVQLGGITSCDWNRDSFDPESPTIVAWPLNNHWEVNFKASQEGEIPLRYRLTTHEGPTDDSFASRFAAEQAVVPIVRHHHERWDGEGYPDRLAGTEIPLLARIVAVADVFDAMLLARTYRPALPLEVALARVLELSGSAFDPDVVEAFGSVMAAGWEPHVGDPALI